MDCIFCDITAGKISSYKVYEDDKVLAFLDILPVHPGHTIIVPKRHVPDIEGLTDEELCAMTIAAKKIGKAILEGLDVKGYSILLDNKDAANQHVSHTHFHVVPRKEGDGLAEWPQGGYDEGEAEEVLKKVQEKLGITTSTPQVTTSPTPLTPPAPSVTTPPTPPTPEAPVSPTISTPPTPPTPGTPPPAQSI